MRKLFGINTVVIKQASSAASSDKQSLMIPGCKEEQLEAIVKEFFPELTLSSLITFTANPYLKIQMALVFAVLPSIFIGLLGFFEPDFFALSIGWLLIGLPFSIKYASKLHLDVDLEVMRLHKGWLFPKTEVVKYYKLQSVTMRQNVFQKRRNVAHLDFYTASGSMRMSQLDAAVAVELYNYILYKIEDSDESWM
ncbi:MAG: putative membrane protein [Vicingaceae bacterium]